LCTDVFRVWINRDTSPLSHFVHFGCGTVTPGSAPLCRTHFVHVALFGQHSLPHYIHFTRMSTQLAYRSTKAGFFLRTAHITSLHSFHSHVHAAGVPCYKGRLLSSDSTHYFTTFISLACPRSWRTVLQRQPVRDLIRSLVVPRPRCTCGLGLFS
jgi:hypothetical protein